MKKIISLVLVLVMALSLSSAAFAEEPVVHKSVEEILDTYHERLAGINGESAGRSTYSLNAVSEADQIKQDTMDTLADAGYEAYDVNADTYESVAATLQTDLGALGITQEGSYIVVVSGEPEENSGVAPAAIVPPDIDQTGIFHYTYEGETFKMRYLTVTAADGYYGYGVAESFDLTEEESDSGVIDDILNTVVSIAVDQIFDGYENLGTLLSLMGLGIPSPVYIRNFTLTYHAATNWTRKYTQAWDDYYECWENGSSVEYVNSLSSVYGTYYDRTVNSFVPFNPPPVTEVVYSNYYNNYTWMNEKAAIGFLGGYGIFDRTGPVKYYFDGSLITTHSFMGVPY